MNIEKLRLYQLNQKLLYLNSKDGTGLSLYIGIYMYR